jgi:hypothetical protein
MDGSEPSPNLYPPLLTHSNRHHLLEAESLKVKFSNVSFVSSHIGGSWFDGRRVAEALGREVVPGRDRERETVRDTVG